MWKCGKCGNDSVPCDEKKRVIKWNFLRVSIAVIVIACIFWLIFGFLTKPDNSMPGTYSELMERSPIITEGSVALEIGGIKINEDIWNYYFMNNAKNYASTNGMEFSEVDWNGKYGTDQTALETVKHRAINDILTNIAIISRADEWKISLSEEEMKRLTELDYQKQVHGDKVYAELGLGSEENFAFVRRNQLLEEKIRDTVSADPQKYAENKKLADYADGRSGTFKIIEIPKENDDNAKSRIEEIKKKLHGGEDFDKLWTEVMGEFYKKYLYEDRTTPEIVYIYKNSIAASHKNMETVGLSLEIGGISDVVETDYSYVIMQRIAGYTEIVNMVVSECEHKINKEIIESSKVL